MTALPPRRAEIAALIDHTLLRPEATGADVEALCAEAIDLGVYAVCVSPTFVGTAVNALDGTVKVATVCGFPSGAHSAEVKALEAGLAAADGADEIDMVVNLALVRTADYGAVQAEVAAVAAAAGEALVKVIIESAALTDDQIRATCRAAVDGGAGYVKTSTGFHPAGGASLAAVGLMRATVGSGIGVKASGGIRTLEQALAMVGAGATRLGCSASAAILGELPE